MKKHALILSLLVLSLAAAGCSRKAEETTAQTTAAETAAAGSAAETESDEEIDEDCISGTITAVNGNIVTVLVDSEDVEKNFDISDAEVKHQFDLSVGDQIYAEYLMEDKDPLTTLVFEVEESVIGESIDPYAEGKIVEFTDNTVTMEIDGEAWTFASGNAYIVAENGIQADQNAVITYIGDLDDEPMAVKIVMEDSASTPEADRNAFIGTIAEVNDEDHYLVLTADNGDFFTFTTELDLSDYSEGETAEIYYQGKISDKEIAAQEIVVK
jgi:hypothetical protein